jgi:lipoyl-dependent peroxiredoxin
MPRIERTAEVTWDGNVARGTGAITAATGVFSALPFSLPTRIGAAEGKTSPEELLAAAHAGCFAMSLASELTTDGTPPGRLDVRCTIVMDEVPGEGHQIVGSNVVVEAEADGASDETLAAALARAHASCPFSTLLGKAGVQLNVELSAAAARS